MLDVNEKTKKRRKEKAEMSSSELSQGTTKCRIINVMAALENTTLNNKYLSNSKIEL